MLQSGKEKSNSFANEDLYVILDKKQNMSKGYDSVTPKVNSFLRYIELTIMFKFW